tara:strand:+ start:706 stop:930 length:225 start_codon:yes stop_codon:yes gene_type:complete
MTSSVPGDVVKVRDDCELLTIMPELRGQIGVVVAREKLDDEETWMPGAVIVKLMEWEDVVFFSDDELEIFPKAT